MHPMTPDLGQNEFLTPEDAVAWGQTAVWGVDHPQPRTCAWRGGQGIKALRRYARQRKWRAVGLMMIFLRDILFNRLLYNSICSFIHFGCGNWEAPMSSNDSALENGGRRIDKVPYIEEEKMNRRI